MTTEEYDSRYPRPTDWCAICGVTRRANKRNPLPCIKKDLYGRRQHWWKRRALSRTQEGGAQ